MILRAYTGMEVIQVPTVHSIHFLLIIQIFVENPERHASVVSVAKLSIV